MQRLEPEESRRADWRFLLPTAGRLEPVAVADPESDQFEQLQAALQAGGACYLEWSSRIRPSARSVTRRLERAGFVDIRLYWSRPRLGPSVWVPLDAPATIRWVLRRRRGRRLLSGAWLALCAAGLVRPRCATARRPPAGEQVGPLGAPLDDLDGRPVWALLAPGSDPLNKIVAFVGTQDRDKPALVLKMPRTEATVSALEREAASLQALGATQAPPPGIPQLLFTYRDGEELRAIAETPLEGRPLFESLDRSRYPELARSATEWLVELGRAAENPRGRTETPADVAADAAAHASPADRDLLLGAGRVAAACEELPVVFEQRDFSPWNVHLAPGGGLVVFDWESAEPAGFPLLDLVYLLAYCGFLLDGALEGERARASYVRTFADGVAEECLARYCGAFAIDTDRVPALRTLTWLVHARAALRRDPSGTSAAPFLDLLREEVMGDAVGGAAA